MAQNVTQRTVMGFGENGNEYSGSIKSKTVLDYLS
jgi:hypothetical protein